jgi:hypothetical protein
MSDPVFVCNKRVPDSLKSTAETINFIVEILSSNILNHFNYVDNSTNSIYGTTVFGNKFQIVVYPFANDTYRNMTMYSIKPFEIGDTNDVYLTSIINCIYEKMNNNKCENTTIACNDESETTIACDDEFACDDESVCNDECEFSNCNLYNININNGNYINCNLYRSELYNLTLNCCKIYNCTLNNCDVVNCKLYNCSFTNKCKFNNCKFNNKPK